MSDDETTPPPVDDETTPPPVDLGAIAGRWLTDGYVVGDDPVPVIGTDTYTLLDGGHFLVHEVDVRVGDQPVRAIEVIGEPGPSEGELLARSYDSLGAMTLMRVHIDDDGIWRFEGGADVAPAARRARHTADPEPVRSALRVDPDGEGMIALWERSDDGVTWRPWMEIRFTRAEPSG